MRLLLSIYIIHFQTPVWMMVKTQQKHSTPMPFFWLFVTLLAYILENLIRVGTPHLPQTYHCSFFGSFWHYRHLSLLLYRAVDSAAGRAWSTRPMSCSKHSLSVAAVLRCVRTKGGVQTMAYQHEELCFDGGATTCSVG